jgi:hypothetical protein
VPPGERRTLADAEGALAQALGARVAGVALRLSSGAG